MVNFSGYFQPLRDSVASLAGHFNLPNCRSLIIVQRQQGGATIYTEVELRPIIQAVSPNTVQTYQGVEGIEIELDDLETQISKAYSRSQIVGRGISYLIDAELVNGIPVGGFEADKVPNVNVIEKGLHWELILRRRP